MAIDPKWALGPLRNGSFTKVLVLSKNLNLITTVSVATTAAGTMGTSWGQGERG